MATKAQSKKIASVRKTAKKVGAFKIPDLPIGGVLSKAVKRLPRLIAGAKTNKKISGAVKKHVTKGKGRSKSERSSVIRKQMIEITRKSIEHLKKSIKAPESKKNKIIQKLLKKKR